MIKFKAVLVRLLKGTIAGAVSTMAMVTITQPVVWTDILLTLKALALAACIGGITGLLMALQKWVSWK